MRNKLLMFLFYATLFGSTANASVIYWNLFNIEDENSVDARYATYATLNDMLTDENRVVTTIAPDGAGVAQNVIGSGSDGTTYWNLFNIEDENSVDARYATYATLNDMLTDENRVVTTIAPDGAGVAQNVIGSGSDGTTYWNLFNIEGENSFDARYATYATLNDMLTDENRVVTTIAPDGAGVAQNVIGSGSDGTTYWNLFNIEGENSFDARYATYATLNDMLTDENRVVTTIAPDGAGVAQNVIGSGAAFFGGPISPIPIPGTIWLLLSGLVGIGIFRQR